MNILPKFSKNIKVYKNKCANFTDETKFSEKNEILQKSNGNHYYLRFQNINMTSLIKIKKQTMIIQNNQLAKKLSQQKPKTNKVIIKLSNVSSSIHNWRYEYVVIQKNYDLHGNQYYVQKVKVQI